MNKKTKKKIFSRLMILGFPVYALLIFLVKFSRKREEEKKERITKFKKRFGLENLNENDLKF